VSREVTKEGVHPDGFGGAARSPSSSTGAEFDAATQALIAKMLRNDVINCVRENNLHGLMSLVQQGASPLVRDDAGQSMMSLAMQNKRVNPEMLYFLFCAVIKPEEKKAIENRMHQLMSLFKREPMAVIFLMSSGLVEKAKECVLGFVREYLTHGFAEDQSENYALLFSALGGDIKLAKNALEGGVDPAVVFSTQSTPKQMSVLEALSFSPNTLGLKKQVIQLITDALSNTEQEKEAVKKMESNTETPSLLLLALKVGNKELFRWLLDAGANVNLVEGDETALSVAAGVAVWSEKPDLTMVEMLLDRGADPTAYINKYFNNDTEGTPRERLLRGIGKQRDTTSTQRDIHQLQAIFDGMCSRESRDTLQVVEQIKRILNKASVKYYLIDANDLLVFQRLSDILPERYFQSCFGLEYIKYAAYQGKLKSLQALLEGGCLPMLTQETLNALFHEAIQNNNDGVALKFLKAGADVMAANESGDPAWLLSSRMTNNRVLIACLESGKVRFPDVEKVLTNPEYKNNAFLMASIIHMGLRWYYYQENSDNSAYNFIFDNYTNHKDAMIRVVDNFVDDNHFCVSNISMSEYIFSVLDKRLSKAVSSRPSPQFATMYLTLASCSDRFNVFRVQKALSLGPSKEEIQGVLSYLLAMRTRDGEQLPVSAAELMLSKVVDRVDRGVKRIREEAQSSAPSVHLGGARPRVDASSLGLFVNDGASSSQPVAGPHMRGSQ